jgi:hypothetical protein
MEERVIFSPFKASRVKSCTSASGAGAELWVRSGALPIPQLRTEMNIRPIIRYLLMP